MIDIVTNNVKQIGTPADEGRVYISEKAYKRIKTEGFKDKEVFVLMGHTESSGGRYATFVEAAIAVYDMEFDKNAPLWTNKVWSRVFAEIKKSYEELIIVGWAFRQENFPAEPTPMLENIHREHFGGAHQLMFLLNRTEQEENFFIKKNNHLKKKTGFFVYYRMNEHCDSADSYNETDTCNKTYSYSNANNNNKIDSYSNADDNNKSSSRMRTLTQRPKAATAGYIEELRQMTVSMCRFLRNLAAYRKNAAGTEKPWRQEKNHARVRLHL